MALTDEDFEDFKTISQNPVKGMIPGTKAHAAYKRQFTDTPRKPAPAETPKKVNPFGVSTDRPDAPPEVKKKGGLIKGWGKARSSKATKIR